MSHQAISLLDLNQQLKGAIQATFSSPIWVRAEIAELRENRNGHSYLDLVDKALVLSLKILILLIRWEIWNNAGRRY
jgi:exonuclease VII large subunit